MTGAENDVAVRTAVDCIKKLNQFGIDWKSEADKSVPGQEKSLMYLGDEDEEIFLRRVVGGVNGADACKLIRRSYSGGTEEESSPINYNGL